MIKVCSKCRRELSIDEFDKNRSKKDGLQNSCRKCCGEYYEQNKGLYSQRQKEYRKSDAGRGVGKRYYRKHRDKINKQREGYRFEYYEQNRDKLMRRAKEYRGTVVGHLKSIFNGMNQRCNNPNTYNYPRYGGRGIAVKFKSPDEFVDYVVNDLQVDPRGLQIDRIDNDGHYEKGNIRFVTRGVNMNNRECSKIV